MTETVPRDDRSQLHGAPSLRARRLECSGYGREFGLYEISRLCSEFESIGDTLPSILGVLADVLPMRTATFVAWNASGAVTTAVWHARGTSAAELARVESEARARLFYLADLTPVSVWAPGTRHAILPPLVARRGPDRARGHGLDRLIGLPLLTRTHAILGALQIELIRDGGELELAHLSAVSNLLALALERHAASRTEPSPAGRAASTGEDRTAVQIRARANRSLAESVRRRLRFLSRASRVLGRTLDHSATVQNAVRLAVPALGALCILELRGADGSVSQAVRATDSVTRRAASLGLEPLVAALQGTCTPRGRQCRRVLFARPTSGATPDTNTGTSVVAAHALRLRAGLAVALHAGDVVLGVLTVYSARPAGYSHAEVQTLRELARRIAAAVENARVHRAAQRAAEGRDQMQAVVSHDLKSPLQSILLNVEILSRHWRELDPAGKLWPRLLSVKHSAESMRRLVGDLLDVAGIEAGHLTVDLAPCAAAGLVEEELDRLRPLAANSAITLYAQIGPGVDLVVADRERIFQVLANLVGNAIKFSPRGESITVELRAHPGRVEFAVIDHGPGISAADLPHVFDRFWQARRTARKGTGLGLTITRGIVEAHGGTIRVESSAGAGTTVFFDLPAAPDRGRAR